MQAVYPHENSLNSKGQGSNEGSQHKLLQLFDTQNKVDN